jgi:hypothetical protein
MYHGKTAATAAKRFDIGFSGCLRHGLYLPARLGYWGAGGVTLLP